MPSEPAAATGGRENGRPSSTKAAPDEEPRDEELDNWAGEIARAARSEQSLRACLRALAARLDRRRRTPSDALRGMMLLGEALLGAREPVSEPEVAQLALVAAGRAHAMEILRQLALMRTRFGELVSYTALNDQQVARVLNWGVANGLIHRTGEGHSSGYHLSPLGELILETSDEPAWMLSATALLRIVVRQKLESPAAEQVPEFTLSGALLDEAKLLTRLPEPQVQRTSSAFHRALDRSAASELALALWVTPASRRHITVAPPVYPHELTEEGLRKGRDDEQGPAFAPYEGMYAPRLDALAEMLVIRTFERSGVAAGALRELLPAHYMRGVNNSRPYRLLLDNPIVSLSSPLVSPVSLGLLLGYGCDVSFDPRVAKQITWGTHTFELTDRYDYAFVLRIFDDETGVTHFVLAGLKPSGTYAACRHFYLEIEAELRRFPNQSFGAVVRAPRNYWVRRHKPEVVIASEPIETSAPPPELRHLDIRYLDALPFIANQYLSPDAGAENRERMTNLLETASLRLDFSTRQRVNMVSDARSPVYRRARDLASLYLSFNRFEQLMVFLLAAEAARSPRTRAASVLRHLEKDTRAEVLYPILKDQLNLADYTAKAVGDLLVNDRDWAIDFVGACTGDQARLKRLEIRSLPGDDTRDVPEQSSSNASENSPRVA